MAALAVVKALLPVLSLETNNRTAMLNSRRAARLAVAALEITLGRRVYNAIRSQTLGPAFQREKSTSSKCLVIVSSSAGHRSLV